MNDHEIDYFIQQLHVIKGASLQGVLYNERALQLKWFLNGKTFWLTISLKPEPAYFFLSTQRIYLIRSLKKPLHLFVKTHFLNLSLQTVRRDQSKGRVVEFMFACEEGCSLIMSLIPGKVNIELKKSGKSIYAFKPQELPTPLNFTAPEIAPREMSFFEEHWQKKHDEKSKSPILTQQKILSKKKSGLIKMQERLTEIQEDCWGQLAAILSDSQSLIDVPSHLIHLVEDQKSLIWNIENAYEKSKKMKLKAEGTQKRIFELEKEIANLEIGHGEGGKKKKVPPKSLLALAGVKGRTVELAEGRLYIGRSGTENLKILRKAKPWDYWIHIKDYPGAHGILARNRGQKVSQSSLEKAALQVIERSVPKGSRGVYEVVLAECRYVRPIKGAKSGQVTFSHERVLILRVSL